MLREVHAPLDTVSYLRILSQSKFLAIPDINKPVWTQCNGSQPHLRGYEA